MDFHSAMETFAEAWAMASAKGTFTYPQSQTINGFQNQSMSLTPHLQGSTSPVSAAVADGQSGPVKSIPVHCIVESINHVYQWSQRHLPSTLHRSKGHVELDRFVIIPNNTAFRDLTEVALVRLGYPKDTAAASKGLVVLKNWLPLDLDTIAEDPVLTVNDVLGELTTLATLRILVFREAKNRFSDLKDKLLKLLLVQSQTQLSASGCPLDEAIILQMMKVGQACPDLPEELYKQFEKWWIVQSSAVGSKMQPSVSVRDMFYRNGSSPRQPNHQENPTNCIVPKADSKAHILQQSVSQNQFQGQKTRMRTSFDTELELPKLQAWFAENPHPSRQQIHHYVSELNNLESRKGRKPLDVNNVVYWFKNARAAQKRAEVRGTNSAATDTMNVGNNDGNCNVNGYCKSSSPSEHGGKSYSGMGSVSGAEEDEDEEEFEDSREDEDAKPVMSPPAEQPMSLTTHGRFASNGDVEPSSSPRPQSRDSEQSADLHKVMVIKEEPPDKEKSTVITTGLNNNDYEDEEDFDEDMDDDASDGGGCKPQLSDDQAAAGHHQHRGSPPPPHQQHPQQSPPPLFHHHNNAADLHQSLVRPGFPMVPNPMFSHSFMYMSQCLSSFNAARRPQTNTPPPPHSQQPQVSSAVGLNLSALAEERRKRNRTFIDPVSEVPRLEQWFELNTHPSHSLIAKYTDELNRMPYRQKFPRLESKNVQFWFKNRRAKCKRLKMSLYDAMSPKDQFNMPPYPTSAAGERTVAKHEYSDMIGRTNTTTYNI